MRGGDLETFRDMFKDRRTHLAVGKILKTELSPDRSVLRAAVSILTQERTVIARVTWDSVGPDAGVFNFPVKDDLVLVAFAEGDDEQAYVISRISSRVDKIPRQATGGHLVLRALQGLKSYLISTSTILLGRGGGSDPAERLVLGDTFKNAYSAHLASNSATNAAAASHTHTDSLGFPTSPPLNAAAFTTQKSAVDAIKASPVDNANMLSDLAKTEK